jgi:hypothetical protein
VYVAAVLLLTGVSTATAKYRGGTGEPNDPYRIATAADLIALGETPEDYDKHFILTADIDLDPNLPGRKVFDKAVIAPDTDPVKGGFEGPAFTGVFDGDRHTILHLTIAGGSCLGLFGKLGSSDAPACEVRNLGLVDVFVMGSGTHIGGLVGYNWGSVTQCYSNGLVRGSSLVGGLVGFNGIIRGSSIRASYSTGSVSGHASVGGLVGYNYASSRISASYSSGTVTGDECVGGLVGFNDHGNTSVSYSSGRVSGNKYVGGLVGCNGGSITTSYSIGQVSGEDQVGGLVGDNHHGVATQCFYDIETSGWTTSAGGTGLTTVEMQTAQTFLDAGWDFVATWLWSIPGNQDYPRLSWEAPLKYRVGSGTAEDPFGIDTAEELLLLGTASGLWDKHFMLAADIDLDPDLAGGQVFTEALIPTFAGVFDGNGHSISHLTIRGGSLLGLFGELADGAVVKNLGLANASIRGFGSSVGALVGHSRGSVIQCCSTGSISAFTMVGGLVGSNEGDVMQSYSISAVGASLVAGGLVGFNDANVVQCYSVGEVSGDGLVGGLAGHNSGSIATSFWDKETLGETTSAGGTGKTTAEMQTASTFLEAGWDFVGETANGTEDIWKIGEGWDYPRLWWETGN